MLWLLWRNRKLPPAQSLGQHPLLLRLRALYPPKSLREIAAFKEPKSAPAPSSVSDLATYLQLPAPCARFVLAIASDSSYHQLMPKTDRSNGGFKLGGKAPDQPIDSASSIGTITTAIHIPRQTWTLLRAVAFRRAQNDGGRASVSKLIAELVERHRKELEREAK
jgi:hypothetical protein